MKLDACILNPTDEEVRTKVVRCFACNHYKEGDIFNSLICPLGFNIYRRDWHISLERPEMGRRCEMVKIAIRYSPRADIIILIINGTLIYHGSPSRPNSKNASFKVTFSLLRDQIFELNGLSNSSFQYDFSLGLNGNMYTDVRKNPEFTSEEIQVLPKKVSVEVSKTQKADGKLTAFYNIIVTTFENKETSCLRRFSDFVKLDENVRSHITKHMLDTLPRGPKKVFNPFSNQLSIDFLNIRKTELEAYLNSLLHHPKVNCLTDYMCFLGLDPISGLALN